MRQAEESPEFTPFRNAADRRIAGNEINTGKVALVRFQFRNPLFGAVLDLAISRGPPLINAGASCVLGNRLLAGRFGVPDG
jgi:hypothetical protein